MESHMIFSHLNGQISASIETYPYCFMSEEAIHIEWQNKYFSNINPFAAENEGERWADTPRFPDPSFGT